MSPFTYAEQRGLTLWSSLRALGNSTVAKFSLAVPVLGYFILFNREIVYSLQLHTSFCASSCSVSWRMQFLYFGGCAFAGATGIYAWFCPTVVKRAQSANDLYNLTAGFFAATSNFEGLIALSKDEGVVVDTNLAQKVENTGPTNKIVALAAMLAELYQACDIAHPGARRWCFALFVIGILLLGVPAVFTFVQVALVTGERLWAAL